MYSFACPIPSDSVLFQFTIFNHTLFNELDNKSLTHSYQIKSDAHQEWKWKRSRNEIERYRRRTKKKVHGSRRMERP